MVMVMLMLLLSKLHMNWTLVAVTWLFFLECGTGAENQATPNLEARLYFTRELFGMSPCI